MGDNYNIIRETILGYSKTRLEWDDYAKKITPNLRVMMAKCFEECRENGFFGPVIGHDGELWFYQATEMHKQGMSEIYQIHEGDKYPCVAKEYLMPNMEIVKRIR